MIFIVLFALAFYSFFTIKELRDENVKLERDLGFAQREVVRLSDVRYRTNASIEGQLMEDYGIVFDQPKFMYIKVAKGIYDEKGLQT